MMYLSDEIRIMLVEDNLDDIELTKRALRKNNLDDPVFIARDGQEAIDYVFREGKFKELKSTITPSVILLDLKLPRVDGLAVLRKIKMDPVLKRIPIIMLTTSKRDEDVISSYDLGVNSYITKPVEFDEFIDTIKTIEKYWGALNTPPLLNGIA